jgi:hypothetical protein
LRDRRTLILFFVLPVFQLFLFAYAVSLTVDHLPTALVDQSLAQPGRDYVQSLVNSGFFDIKLILNNEQEVIQAIDAGQVKAGVVIPADFPEQVARGVGVEDVRVVDAFDPSAIETAVRECIEADQPSVIVARGACSLQIKLSGKALSVTAGDCDGCAACLRVGCPAVAFRDGKAWIDHATIVKGGTLRFVMGSTPNRQFGAAPEAAPPSMSSGAVSGKKPAGSGAGE